MGPRNNDLGVYSFADPPSHNQAWRQDLPFARRCCGAGDGLQAVDLPDYWHPCWYVLHSSSGMGMDSFIPTLITSREHLPDAQGSGGMLTYRPHESHDQGHSEGRRGYVQAGTQACKIDLDVQC